MQETTSAIVAALQSLASERNLNESFMAIVRDGTGKTFEREQHRRPVGLTPVPAPSGAAALPGTRRSGAPRTRS